MILKGDGGDPRVLAKDPTRVVKAELRGPRPSDQAIKRRLVGFQVGLMLGSIVASVLLYTVLGIDAALADAGPLMAEMYGFVGVLVPAAHAGLAFLLVSGVANAGRYAQRGTLVMILVHLAASGGIMVGHLQALPLGLVLVGGNLLFLWWLRPVRASLDAGKGAPAGLGR